MAPFRVFRHVSFRVVSSVCVCVCVRVCMLCVVCGRVGMLCVVCVCVCVFERISCYEVADV